MGTKRAHVADWENLRFFLALHRTGSLSEAARRLSVDHTTVSRRIAALERSLGLRLFDRSPRGYEPTRAGDELRPSAIAVEDQVLALERCAGLGSEHAGVVRIATTNQLATDFLIPALPKLRARYPGIMIEVSAESREHDLARREADLAVRLGRPRATGLVTRKLAELAHGFYVARNVRRSGELDLARDAFLTYDDSLAHLAHERWFAQHVPARNIVFRANNLVCLQAAVRAGLGVALLPCFVGDPDPVLERVPTSIALDTRELWLVVHGELRRSPRIRVVLDFLAEHASAMTARFAGGSRT